MRKNMPKAINEIQWRRELKVEEPGDKTDFEIIIKERGKIVYRNKGYAGVVNIVHSIDEFDIKELSFTGDTQAFGFGHPCIQMFALDQLRQKLRAVAEQSVGILYKLTGNPKLKEFMEAVGRVNSIKKRGNGDRII